MATVTASYGRAMETTPHDISPATARRITITAWAMAAFGTVAGELHALSRFNSHPDDLTEGGFGSVWAVPALDAFRPLLEWGDPYFVYWTYGKIWLPIFLTRLVSAWIVFRRRRPLGAERLAWRILLTAFAVVLLAFGVPKLIRRRGEGPTVGAPATRPSGADGAPGAVLVGASAAAPAPSQPETGPSPAR